MEGTRYFMLRLMLELPEVFASISLCTGETDEQDGAEYDAADSAGADSGWGFVTGSPVVAGFDNEVSACFTWVGRGSSPIFSSCA